MSLNRTQPTSIGRVNNRKNGSNQSMKNSQNICFTDNSLAISKLDVAEVGIAAFEK